MHSTALLGDVWASLLFDSEATTCPGRRRRVALSLSTRRTLIYGDRIFDEDLVVCPEGSIFPGMVFQACTPARYACEWGSNFRAKGNHVHCTEKGSQRVRVCPTVGKLVTVPPIETIRRIHFPLPASSTRCGRMA